MINGKAYGYESISFRIDGGAEELSVSEISYSHKLTPGIARGTSAKKLGRTRGQYEADGGFTMDKDTAARLITALGPAYMTREFGILVSYRELGMDLVSDYLMRCRIVGEDDAHTAGGEALATKFTLDVMELKKNGISAIAAA